MGWDGIKNVGVNTQFGKPGGNIPNGGGAKGGGKTIRQRMAELMDMDVDELKAYAEEPKNPVFLRKAAKIMAEVTSVKELAMATDMVESKPAQIINASVQDLPPILTPIDIPNATNNGGGEDTTAE